jgi:hypothetical protein
MHLELVAAIQSKCHYPIHHQSLTPPVSTITHCTMSSRRQPAKHYLTNKGKGKYMPELDDSQSYTDPDDEVLDIPRVTNMTRGMASSITANRKRMVSKAKPKPKTTKATKATKAPNRKLKNITNTISP